MAALDGRDRRVTVMLGYAGVVPACCEKITR